MADQDNYKTYVRETRTTETSGASMALIVGGLVVAVGFILWLVFGGPGPVSTTPTGSDTNVTIEPPAAPVDNSTNLTIQPAAPDAAAPVDGAEPVAPAGEAEPVAPAQP